MDYRTEVVNITKIKEGFYIGDEPTAINLEVIIQFKLTHIINAAGSQIINAWETIGIKYLTLNWSENPNQNLFDSKDEIANRIVSFIDDSFNKGEGLLAHSVRGQNRVCLVVIIYLMKKYKWGLNKCLEFLQSKKQDVDIPKYFLNQISLFENRLMKKGEGTKSTPWTEEDLPDCEELLMRNTYVNGLPNNPSSQLNTNNKAKRHIGWADCNPYQKEVLVQVNPSKDLYNQKEIKPVTAHKRLIPNKSSIKKRSYSTNDLRPVNTFNNMMSANLQEDNRFGLNNKKGGMSNSISVGSNPANNSFGLINQNDPSLKKSSELLFDYSQLYSNATGNNPANSNNQNPTNTSIAINTSIAKQTNEIRTNHFVMENGPQQRSASYTSGEGVNNQMNTNQQYNMKTGGYNIGTANSLNPANIKNYSMMKDTSNNQMPNVSNNSDKSKIIIASKYEQIVNNNINNYFIQNPGAFSTTNKYTYTPQNNSTANSNQKTASQPYQNQTDHKPTSPLLNSNNGLGPIPNISINPLSATVNTNLSNNNYNNYQFNNLTPTNQGQMGVNNYDPKQLIIKDNKISKNSENQRNSAQNNYLYDNSNQVNEKKFKIIDYPNNSNNNMNIIGNYSSLNNTDYNQNKNQFLGYPSNMNGPTINNYIPGKGQNSNVNTNINNNNPTKQTTFTSSIQPKPLNNYNPNLNKKNINNGGALFNRTNTQSKGPIKIKNDYRKPATPDQINSISNFGSRHGISGKQQEMVNYGSNNRTNSKNKNDAMNRPSTAPQKDKTKYKPSNPYSNTTATNKNYSNTMKRLPSPQIQSNNSLGKTQKVNTTKYRAPSPMIKSTSMTIGPPGKSNYQKKKY